MTGDGPSVVILADDLIWASRLSDGVTAAGGTPRRVRRQGDFVAALAEDAEHQPAFAIVDLTAIAYDGIAAIADAIGAGVRVIAVGQHDDLELRKRALAAGAERVYAYRKLFEDGPALLRTWLASGAANHSAAARGTPASAAS